MTTAPPEPDRTRMAKPKAAKSKFGGIAVVCSKCAKRQGVPARAIRKLLKDAHGAMRPAAKGKGRKLCIVESGCLGPCPKRAVAVGTAASLAEGRVLLLDPEGGAEAARAALLPEFGPIAGLAADRDTTGAVDETAESR